MAQVKNKRNAGLADRVNNKKKSEGIKKKLNPFEVHINKEKIKVLGKKTKHDRGLPGVSRAKAVQKGFFHMLALDAAAVACTASFGRVNTSRVLTAAIPRLADVRNQPQLRYLEAQ